MKRSALAHVVMRVLPFALQRVADRTVRLVFSLTLLLAAWPAAAQVFEGTAFSYQGELRQSNAPVSGSEDMVFTLYDSASGGTVIGTPISLTGANAVAVVSGIFTVTLDFGGPSFMTMTDDARWLEVKVGSNTLSPRTKIENAPYALTSQLAYSVVAGSIGTTQINSAQVQRRVSGTCASGSSISVINVDGTVSCQAGGGGGAITSVSGSNGVVASTASGAVSLSADTSFVQKRVTGTCASGSSINTVNADGTVACQSAGTSFTLPYAATQANAGPLISITNADPSSASTALQGTTNSTAANVSAVVGTVSSSSPGFYSAGVRGINNSTTANGVGVYGTTAGSGAGVNGNSNSGVGVFGSSNTGTGVSAQSSSGIGLYATSSNSFSADIANTNVNNSAATLIISTNGSGTNVASYANTGQAILASSNSGTGVEATSGSGRAGQFYNNNSANTSNVLEVTTNTAGVAGDQTGIGGALFQVTNNNSTAAAVHGIVAGNIFPVANGTAAIYGTSTGFGTAGFFEATNTTSPSGGGLALLAIGSGSGPVAKIRNTTVAGGPALDVGNSGSGAGIYSANYGSGSGLFVYVDTANGATGNEAIFQNTGANGSGTSPVDVARIDYNGAGFFNGGTFSSGADLAEIVATSGATPQPGDVVEIDPDRPDSFRLSSAAASTRVAGVISTKPSVTMNVDDGATTDATGPAIALAGRVSVKVSDENGAIRIGDLLVASSSPGRAMRAPDDPQVGTVIGKALQELRTPEGTITMLVWMH